MAGFIHLQPIGIIIKKMEGRAVVIAVPQAVQPYHRGRK